MVSCWGYIPGLPDPPDASELEEQIEKLQAQVLDLQDAKDSSAYLVAELCRKFLGWQGSDAILAKRAADDYGEDGWIEEIAYNIHCKYCPF